MICHLLRALGLAGVTIAALAGCSATTATSQPASPECDDKMQFEMIVYGGYGLQHPTPFVMLLPYIPPEYLRDQRRSFEVVATLPTDPLVGVAPHDLCQTRSSPTGAELVCLDETGTPQSVDVRSAIERLARKYKVDAQCATVLDHIGQADLGEVSRGWNEDHRGCQPSPKSLVPLAVTLRLEPKEVEHRSTVTGADHIPREQIRTTQHVRLSLHAPALGLSRELGLLDLDEGCMVASFHGRPAAMCGSGRQWSPRQLVVYQSATQLLFRTAFTLERSLEMNAVSLPCGQFAAVTLDESAMNVRHGDADP